MMTMMRSATDWYLAGSGVPQPTAKPSISRHAERLLNRRSALRIEIVLEQQGRRHGIEIGLAAARRAAHFPDGGQHACRGHSLVPHGHLHSLGYAPFDSISDLPSGVSGVTFSPRFIQRQTDDNTYDLIVCDVVEQLRHRESLPGAAGERGERLGERLRFVGEGEANPALAPIDGEKPAFHPCDIVWKNSAFVFVRFSRSSRNSIASTGGMSDRKFRSR